MLKSCSRGFSQTFYRELLHETVYGFPDLESFMVGFWEAWACSKGMARGNSFSVQKQLLMREEPENMLVMLHTWQTADCSKQEPYNGDFNKAMKAIKARTLVLPGQTDLYFP